MLAINITDLCMAKLLSKVLTPCSGVVYSLRYSNKDISYNVNKRAAQPTTCS